MFDIDIRADIASITKRLTQLEQRELPYATALALTDLAREVADAERESMAKEMDRPAPFTKNALGVIPARKTRLVATVFVKDIQARYLEPLEFDDKRQRLGAKRGILKPADQPTNAYGNLPKGTVGRLKGRQNIFIGAVQTRGAGEIRGVWERVELTAKGKTRRKAARGTTWTEQYGRLKLLIRFQDAVDVKPQWNYRERARQLVGRRYAAVFGAAMVRALGG